MSARGQQLGEEADGHALDRVDPERRARRAAPGELPRRARVAGGHRVLDDAEAEPEPDAVERGLREQRAAELLEVPAAGQLVGGHQLERARAEDAGAFELA